MVQRQGYGTFTSHLERRVNRVNDFLQTTFPSNLMHFIQYKHTNKFAIIGILIMLTSL